MINMKQPSDKTYKHFKKGQGRQVEGGQFVRREMQTVNLSERCDRDEALRGSILAKGMTISADLLWLYPRSCAEEQSRSEKIQILLLELMQSLALLPDYI